MKKWVQISILSILIACVANIGYLNHKAVDFRRDIWYTQGRTTQLVQSLYKRDCELLSRMLEQKDELSKPKPTIASVVENVISSVVYIRVKGEITNPYSGKVEESEYSGAGFVYNTEGHILTTGHIINSIKFFKDPVISVQCYEGKTFKVLEVKTNYKNEDPNLPDIGLIKIDTEGIKLNPVVLGEKNPKIGETVILIGHPKNLLYAVSSGIVSRIGNTPFFKDGLFLQTEAVVNPGNSGGPIFGLDGKVYGIVAFILRFDEQLSLEGLNFAVPVSVINENIQKMIEELECGVVNE